MIPQANRSPPPPPAELKLASPIARLAAIVRTASGWRKRGIAFGAGAISTLAFAPVFAWPILFLTFPILVWQIEAAATAPRPIRSAAVSAWWFGFGYFFTGLMWIGEAFLVEAEIFAWLLPFAVTLLPAGLALFWALAGALTQAITATRSRAAAPSPHDPTRIAIARCLTLAVALSATEWLRGHVLTGFPWNVPGVALTQPLPLMQTVSLFGIYGLTLWAIFLLSLPLALIAACPDQPRRAGCLAALITAIPLVFAYALGSWHLAAPPSRALPGIKFRVVQPSVPQRDKWIPAKQREIFADHLDLSRRDPSGNADGLNGITHLIWPEAAMPFRPLEHPEALAAIGELLLPSTQLLAGGLRFESDSAGNRRAFNSLMVFGASGALTGLYDKVHLVPFGEYLPFQSTLEAIGLQSLTRQRGGFASGPLPKPLLQVAGLPPVSPLICYEAIFPSLVAADTGRPGLIVIVTNDGWFGNSIGPPQHFHQARLRAVEQGLTVVRAANNGISAVIDPEGRILTSLALNARGSIDSAIPSARSRTWYAKWGDATFVLNSAIFLLLALWLSSSPPFAYGNRTKMPFPTPG